METQPAVGLDVGTHSVKVAQVRASRNRAHAVNFGGVALPEGAVREGEVVDPSAVADSIRQLLAATGIKAKKVRLGVANQRVVVRQIDLPWMEPAELRSSLRFQVQEHIPIAVDEAELDFHVLDDYEQTDGVRMLRILLVAAAKDMVASHVAAATEAGLRPVSIDLNPFAVLRALQCDSPLDDGADEAHIDVGAGVTTIVVHQGGMPRFVRILALGGEDITHALAQELDVDRAEAEQIKQNLGMTDAADDPAGRIITDHGYQFVDEIRSSLDYYDAQSGGGRVSRVVLTGGGQNLPNLMARLGDELRLPVEVGDPFDLLPTKGVALGPDELRRVGPVLTTAVGLALGDQR